MIEMDSVNDFVDSPPSKRYMSTNNSTIENETFESFVKAVLKIRDNDDGDTRDDEWSEVNENNDELAYIDENDDIDKENEIPTNGLNGEYVQLYDSTQSIDENDLAIPEKKEKKPKENKKWLFKCEYPSSELAKSALEMESTWSVWKRSDTADGMKYLFRCNKVKLRDTQCAAQVYHLFKNDSDHVLEFRTDGAHDHQKQMEAAEAKQRLVEEIDKLLKLNQKPNEIMDSLSKIDGLVLPTKQQLINIIAKLRKQKYGPPTISMQELSKWLQYHSSVPEDEHESFVLCFEVNIEAEEPYFRFIITTKYLLNLAKHRKLSHADTTYKCIWQGFPVFMVGTTDFCKAYHAFGLAVCTNEKTDDFHFVFKGMKEGLLRIFGYEMVQTTLIADAAFAIINAFIEVHGPNVIIIMCWYHAKTAMKEKLTLVKEANRVAILEDMEFLHLASSDEIFRYAANLFIDKWEKQEPEYLNYFQSEWIQKHPNWYLGAAEFTPCHNNALESSNRYLKETNTIRIRHPLPHFLRVASETVHKWSNRYVIGTKSFAFERNIDLPLWTAGYQWAKSNVQAKIISQNDEKMMVSVNATVTRSGNPRDKDGVAIQSSITQSELLSVLEEEEKELQSMQKIGCQPTAVAKRQKNIYTGKGRAKSGREAKTEKVRASQATVSATATSQPTTAKRQKKTTASLTAESSQSIVSSTAQSSQATGSLQNVGVPVAFSKQIAEFEKYKQTFLHWTITISKTPNSLNDCRCNCPAFLKEYMCKHVIGLSIRMKYVSAPPEAKTVPIGEKRKRGRPAKTKPALLIQ